MISPVRVLRVSYHYHCNTATAIPGGKIMPSHINMPGVITLIIYQRTTTEHQEQVFFILFLIGIIAGLEYVAILHKDMLCYSDEKWLRSPAHNRIFTQLRHNSLSNSFKFLVYKYLFI